MTSWFYVSGLLCIYSYFLYPIILKLIPARKFDHESQQIPETELPMLSLIITAGSKTKRRKRIKSYTKYSASLLVDRRSPCSEE